MAIATSAEVDPGIDAREVSVVVGSYHLQRSRCR